MSILINKNTRVLVQGITGHHGTINTKAMLAYGTNIVAGVTPGKGGQTVEGVPVYNTVKEAVKKHHPNWSILFVPAPFAKAAAFEALKKHLNLVIITEEIPIHDAIDILKFGEKQNCTIIGPNCPGLMTPGECKLGIIPGNVVKPGNVGIVSRSGTLTHEIANLLTEAGIGQSTIVGIGGDRIIGSDFEKILRMFEKDKQTKVVVLLGEIGGVLEQKAAQYIKKMKKPVVAYITGQSAPPNKQMGHAGAIAYGAGQTAQAKMNALKAAGVSVAKTTLDVTRLVKKAL
ncbi:MAG TPA: succinate--CoA ligase subunit alpha [Candidatus Nanoarchaeia archaeon]|nr:succinate--CoA ligase subunit alpha [Candidatus Nanoarchaeia archaeon]